jgi:hypothetical protein
MFTVCHANYCFIGIDIGAYGREGDASIFASSQFAEDLDNGCLGIQELSTLIYFSNLSPYVFVMVMFDTLTCYCNTQHWSICLPFYLEWCISIENQHNEAIFRTKCKIIDWSRTNLQLQVEFNTFSIYFSHIRWKDRTAQYMCFRLSRERRTIKMLSGFHQSIAHFPHPHDWKPSKCWKLYKGRRCLAQYADSRR